MLENQPITHVGICRRCPYLKIGEADETLGRLRQELAGTPNVNVYKSGCWGKCSSGPIVMYSKYSGGEGKTVFFKRVGMPRIFGGTRVKDIVKKVKQGMR